MNPKYRISRVFPILAAVFAAGFLLASCSSSKSPPPPPPPPPPPVTVTSVTIAAQASAIASATEVANGGVVQFGATANMSNGTSRNITSSATWASGDATTIAFDNAALPGAATGKKQGGPITITATDAGGTAGTLPYSVVAPVPQSIAIDPAQVPNGVPVGQQGNFKATYTMTDKSTGDATSAANWTSSAGAIVAVGNDAGNKGKAIALAPGDSTIGAGNGTLAAPGVNVTVFAPTQPPQFVVEPSTPNQLPLGKTQQFKALLKYSTEQVVDVTERVTWESSAENLAQFPSDWPKGLLLANPTTAGQLTVTARDPATGTQTTGITVTVSALTIDSVAITPVKTAGNPMAVGTNRQLGVIATYSDNISRDITQRVDWATGGLGYLEVTNSTGSKGLVRANVETPAGMPKDSVVITDPVSSQSVSLEIETLGRTLDRIGISPIDKQQVPLGHTVSFKARAYFTDGSDEPATDEVTWESSGPDKVAISNQTQNKGVATAIKLGDSVINAAYVVNGVKKLSNYVVVSAVAATLETVEIKPTTAVSLPLGGSQKLTADGVFSDGSRRDISGLVNWRSGDTGIVTVGNSGKTKGTVTGVATGGPISVTATEPRTSRFASKPVSVTGKTFTGIAIFPTGPIIRPVGIPYKDFVANAVFSDGSGTPITEAVQWTSSDPAIAVVSNEAGTRGHVFPRAIGQVTVTASAQGITSPPVTFTVDAAVLQSIAISPSAPQDINVGQTVQFSATGTYSDTQTRDITESVTWASDNRSIAFITNNAPNNGKLVGASAGLANVTASRDGVTSAVTEVVVSAGAGVTTGQLSVTVEVGGNVVSEDGSTVNCGSGQTCNVDLPIGTVIKLFALATTGNHFDDWNSCDSENGPTCTMTIDNPQEGVTAEFDPN